MTPYVSRIDAEIDTGVVVLCAAALVLAAVLAAPAVLQDGDLYWRIVTGRWMLDNQAVLRIDMFSATYAGQPWQAQGWLADAALALAYVGVGWSGVLAWTAGFAALSAGLFAHFLSRRLSGVVLAVTLALGIAVGAGGLTASPLVMALPFFILWCGGLAEARAQNRAPSLFLIPAMIVWANLDTSYLAGLALALILSAEAVLEAKGNRLAASRGWAVFSGFALLGCLITPYGIMGFSAALHEVQTPPIGPVRTLLPLLLALPSVVVMAQSRAFRLRLVFLAVLFGMALHLKADQVLFAVATPLLLADTTAHWLQQTVAPRRFPLKPALAFTVIAAGALALRLVMPLARGDEPISPQTALSRVPQPLLHAHVLNDEAFGGYLIFRDVRPYIDTRSIYGAGFRERFERMTGGDAVLLAATLDRRHIRWTIFAPGNPGAAAMDGLKNWQRLYADQWAVVHVRKGAL